MFYPFRFTDLGAALDASKRDLEQLGDPERPKYVLLLTDGVPSQPGDVPGRDAVGGVRPQNAMFGGTLMLGPQTVNEFRLGYNRSRLNTGTPEPVFNVGGQSTNLPLFVLSGYSNMGGLGGGW